MTKHSRALISCLVVTGILLFNNVLFIHASNDGQLLPASNQELSSDVYDNHAEELLHGASSLDNQYLAELREYNFEHTTRMQENLKDDLATRSSIPSTPLSTADTYNLGDTDDFWVSDDYRAWNGIDDDSDGATDLLDDPDEAMYEVTAEVVRVTDHAYLFLDENETDSVTTAELNDMASAFEDTIYPVETDLFGQPPDIDSNSRIIILITDLRDEAYYSLSSLYIAGYFWLLHTVDPSGYTSSDPYYYSEYKEIIHIDTKSFDVNIDQDTVAHELQHLLHYNNDEDETVWLDEGCAVLAEHLTGYTAGWSPYVQGSQGFTNHPGTSLTYWEGTMASYGAVFTFFLMLQQVYGNNTITDIVTDSSRQGMPSIEEATGLSGDDLFAEFAYRNIINDVSKGYGYEIFTAEASSTAISSLPYTSTNVAIPFWSSKYYSIPDDDTGILNVTVEGVGLESIHASLLVLNQSGIYETRDVKGPDNENGNLLLNGFGTDYTDAFLVIYSINGTDSGWDAVSSVEKDRLNIWVDILNLATYHGSVDYSKTSYSETINFNNITVINSLTGINWGYGDVINHSTAIYNQTSQEEITGIEGIVQYNNTHDCWQAYFNNVTALSGGIYYIEVTLTTSNTTAIIRSDSFEIIRPIIINSGTGGFSGGTLSYTGIIVGSSDGTAWSSTIDASFEIYHENDTLITEADLLWDSVGETWYLPVLDFHLNSGDGIYLVFTFVNGSEEVSFTSDIIVDNGASDIPGFTVLMMLVTLTAISTYILVIERKRKRK